MTILIANIFLLITCQENFCRRFGCPRWPLVVETAASPLGSGLCQAPEISGWQLQKKTTAIVVRFQGKC